MMMILKEFILFFAESRQRQPERFFRIVAAFYSGQTVF